MLDEAAAETRRKPGCLAYAGLGWIVLGLLLTFAAPVVFGSCFERVMHESFVDNNTKICSHTGLSWTVVVLQVILMVAYAAVVLAPAAEPRSRSSLRLFSGLAVVATVGFVFIAGMDVRIPDRRPGSSTASGTTRTTVTTTTLDFTNQDLSGRDLTGVDFTGARLRSAVLAGADLMDRSFVRADLQDANLSGADLRGASFRFASLVRSDLSGVNAGSAVFADSDMTEAILADANLTDADFRRTQLQGADLSGATLHGADLAGTDLSTTNLRNVSYDTLTRWPPGSDPP